MTRAHIFVGARPRLSVLLLFIRITLSGSARFRSSTWCCPPTISSITIDHDEFFELPFSQASG